MTSGGKTSGILKAAQDRTTSKLASLHSHLQRVRHQVESGKLDDAFRKQGERAIPSLSRLCIEAGIGRYFLYGPSHRDTTAQDVSSFREELVRILKRRAASSDLNGITSASNELNELKAKYQALADHTHLWHLRMRAIRYELKQMKRDQPPKIVSLKPKS